MCSNVCGVWCEGFAPHRLRGISGFHRKKAPACRIFPGKSRKKSGAFAPTLKMFKHFDWISSKSTCICQNLFESVWICLNVFKCLRCVVRRLRTTQTAAARCRGDGVRLEVGPGTEVSRTTTSQPCRPEWISDPEWIKVNFSPVPKIFTNSTFQGGWIELNWINTE